MTDRLERSAPAFVKVVSSYDEIDFAECRLLLAVTPRLFESPVRTVFYRPKVLCLGLGSERGIDPVRFLDSIGGHVAETGFSLHSLKAVGTVDFKMNEVAFLAFADARGLQLQGFAPDRLSSVASVPNPSEVVFAKTGIYSVSEAASALLAGNEKWLVQKQKVAIKVCQRQTSPFYFCHQPAAECRPGGTHRYCWSWPG